MFNIRTLISTLSLLMMTSLPAGASSFVQLEPIERHASVAARFINAVNEPADFQGIIIVDSDGSSKQYEIDYTSLRTLVYLESVKSVIEIKSNGQHYTKGIQINVEIDENQAQRVLGFPTDWLTLSHLWQWFLDTFHSFSVEFDGEVAVIHSSRLSHSGVERINLVVDIRDKWPVYMVINNPKEKVIVKWIAR